jgi:hypothetical protein
MGGGILLFDLSPFENNMIWLADSKTIAFFKVTSKMSLSFPYDIFEFSSNLNEI